MKHIELLYSLVEVQDNIDSFLEDDEYQLSKKELVFLVKSFYGGIIKTRDYPYAIASFKRLIDSDLFFMIKEDGSGYYCTISSKGIIYINNFIKYLDGKFDAFDNSNKLDMSFLKNNYLPSSVGKKRLVSTAEAILNKPKK